MSSAALNVIHAGLQALESHPLLKSAPEPGLLAKFGLHSLAFAEAMGHLLEKRVAHNIDRHAPKLHAIAWRHLRLHQPFARDLRRDLTQLGRPRNELDNLTPSPLTRACLKPIEAAIDHKHVLLAHILVVQGLECLTQLIAEHGVTLATDIGGVSVAFERRLHGHEDLIFEGLDVLFSPYSAETHSFLLSELEDFFCRAWLLLDEWLNQEPKIIKPMKHRMRSEHWGTGNRPFDAA